jgi:hypothetical protein
VSRRDGPYWNRLSSRYEELLSDGRCLAVVWTRFGRWYATVGNRALVCSSTIRRSVKRAARHEAVAALMKEVDRAK